MYLSNTTEKLQIVLAGAVTTNQLVYNVSYQDVTATGMTLPQSSSQGLTNSTTDVDMVTAPAAATTRQIALLNIYNNDTVSAGITIKKDNSGTDYIMTTQLLQPGDTLYWSKNDGWTVFSSTSQSKMTFTTFTANGTYTKPAGLKAAFVFCAGAGGGGGGGCRNAAGTNRIGGGGGGVGANVWRFLLASEIAATTTVTIGTGGTSGAAAVADNTNGGNAGVGGNTSFGALLIAKGGNGGSGGTTGTGSAGAGGNASLCTPSLGPYSLGGFPGGGGNTTSLGAPSQAFSGQNAGSGGGNGGMGINSSNVAGGANVGGGTYDRSYQINGPSSGATPNGVNSVTNFLHFSLNLSSGIGLGTGGASGYPTFVNGGNGGYGGGGAGGSGVLNGTTSGAGGTGGDGLCLILNIF